MKNKYLSKYFIVLMILFLGCIAGMLVSLFAYNANAAEVPVFNSSGFEEGENSFTTDNGQDCLWDRDGNPSIENVGSDARTGSYVAVLNRQGAAVGIRQRVTGLERNTDYMFSFYAKRQGDCPDGLGLFYGARLGREWNAPLIREDNVSVSSLDDYTKIDYVFNSADNTELWFFMTANNADGMVYIDDVSLMTLWDTLTIANVKHNFNGTIANGAVRDVSISVELSNGAPTTDYNYTIQVQEGENLLTPEAATIVKPSFDKVTQKLKLTSLKPGNAEIVFTVQIPNGGGDERTVRIPVTVKDTVPLNSFTASISPDLNLESPSLLSIDATYGDDSIPVDTTDAVITVTTSAPNAVYFDQESMLLYALKAGSFSVQIEISYDIDGKSYAAEYFLGEYTLVGNLIADAGFELFDTTGAENSPWTITQTNAGGDIWGLDSAGLQRSGVNNLFVRTPDPNRFENNDGTPMNGNNLLPDAIFTLSQEVQINSATDYILTTYIRFFAARDGGSAGGNYSFGIYTLDDKPLWEIQFDTSVGMAAYYPYTIAFNSEDKVVDGQLVKIKLTAVGHPQNGMGFQIDDFYFAEGRPIDHMKISINDGNQNLEVYSVYSLDVSVFYDAEEQDAADVSTAQVLIKSLQPDVVMASNSGNIVAMASGTATLEVSVIIGGTMLKEYLELYVQPEADGQIPPSNSGGCNSVIAGGLPLVFGGVAILLSVTFLLTKKRNKQ